MAHQAGPLKTREFGAVYAPEGGIHAPMKPRISSLSTLLACSGLIPALSLGAPGPTAEQLDFFEKKVRPILTESCYKCHSLERGKAKGDLTLDTRVALLKGGKNGPAIVPGSPEKSLLITAVHYTDPDMQMPPKGEKLSSPQIAALTEWVRMGAPDPRLEARGANGEKLSGLTDKARLHWAYQPLQKPAVPVNKNQQWCRTPVDAFILKKLEEKGMLPAPDAEKETLLRRATYDLIGLPPTPLEVDAFLRDTSPNAFSKVVDRLLASPHYGERWGRFWLDTARYSDTAGGNPNAQRNEDYRFPYAWTYRDYVIKSLNEDRPYNQFILEQLAADKLPSAQSDKTKLAALGFLTVGERFRNPNDVINDRIDVVTKGFLGMTVTCARCHDHMFDPIPTEDYYALHGIFASTLEPTEKPLILTPSQAQLEDFQKKMSALESENRGVYYRFQEKQLEEFQSKAGGYLMALRSGAKTGGLSAEDIDARNQLIEALKLQRDLLPLFGRDLRLEDPVFGPFRAFANLSEEDFPNKAPELAARFAANSESRNKINPWVAKAFAGTPPANLQAVADTYTRLFLELKPQRAAYLAAQESNQQSTGFDPHFVALLEAPLEVRPALKVDTLFLKDFAQKIPRQVSNRIPFVFAKINELELTHPGAPARAMLVADAKKAKNSPVFIRGQAENKGALVPRRFLEVLSHGKPEPFKEGSGRLELAQAIASKSNPLTARVLVNRTWMHHFGEGFVPTPDDLGTQSEAPSHPELLDYLSIFFMENGWSLKKLHKIILLSRVYQESSRTLPQFEAIDPENRLLWRANIRRLDFESMRDSLLVFSGKLDRTLGGKPVNLTDEPYSYRRSAYGYIDRGNLPEIMSQFNFSDPQMPNSRRIATIVPQQALFLMNSPMSVDVARRIIARPEVTGVPDALGRVFAIYRIMFQRNPTPQEIRLALEFVSKEAKLQPGLENAAESPENRKIVARQTARLVNKNKTGRASATRPIQNEGDWVERKPLTPWETLAQSLLFTNELAYVN